MKTGSQKFWDAMNVQSELQNHVGSVMDHIYDNDPIRLQINWNRDTEVRKGPEKTSAREDKEEPSKPTVKWLQDFTDFHKLP
jgi:hypothetical protein